MACGLADHTLLLGRALAAQGAQLSLLALRGDPAAAREAGWPGPASVWDGSDDNLSRWLRIYAPDWLLVQLSGYGYSRWGAPWGLAHALVAARRRAPRLRIAVVVHETHCDPAQLGPKGLALSLWQRWTTGRIARLADLVLPTIGPWRLRCIRLYRTDPARTRLLPLASAIQPIILTEESRHDIRHQLGLLSRDRVAVAFGRWDSQRQALERLGPAIRQALEGRTLQHVVIVGGEQTAHPPWVARFLDDPCWRGRLSVLGPRPATQVAEVLAACDVGLVPTPWPVWEKSSAARALQQAGLTLWVWDPGGYRVLRPPHAAPTWSDLARQLYDWLLKAERHSRASVPRVHIPLPN